jgi:hypothetical protein
VTVLPNSSPDPYAYPTPGEGFSKPTGKQLLSASWGMLKQDRELLWLPTLGALFGVVAAVILFVPGWFLGDALDGPNHHSWAGAVGGVLAAFGASIVSIFFQAALVVGANERADGGDPTFRSALRGAWERRGRIFSWALLTTTVGTTIRAIEERLGIVGSLLGFLAGLAWAVASFLVVPVLVVEDIGPINAVKRSAALIKQTWGTSLRTTLRFGLTQIALMLLPMFVLFIGVVIVAGGSAGAIVVGGALIVVAVVAFLALAMVFSAIGSYARALIYRYATGRPVPGIDPYLFTGVFRPKRSRRRRFA